MENRPSRGMMVDLPPEFRTTPFSCYVWSRSRRAGHVLAFALARFIDPAFRWITIRESTAEPSAEETWVAQVLPKAQVLPPVAVSDFGAGPRVSRESFSSLFRAEGTVAERTALSYFLLLPPQLQAIMDEEAASPGTRAIVLANTNRIRALYPTDAGRIRVMMEVFPRNGFSVITTSMPPPYQGRYGYSIAFRMDVDSAEEWRRARLVVEKGLPSGELRTGATFSSEELPWYLDAGSAIESASD
jgi:hypothetical protein